MSSQKKKIIPLVVLLPMVLLNAQSKTLYQFLKKWPAGCDTTGKRWVVYNINRPETHFVNQSTTGSQTTTSLWMANIGNFNGGVNPWAIGDTLIAFGSIDTAYINNPLTYGSNPNHTGFYWLYSDTVIMSTPEQWWPDDTVRVMPKPRAIQLGAGPTGRIDIAITNPSETRRGDGSYCGGYHVLGYWVWADTTSGTYYGTRGRPAYFDKEVGFFPVQGGPGAITVCSHPLSNYRNGQTVYWAYKIVVRPDTSAKGSRQVCPGYSTYYFSQNSNPIILIGIEESGSGLGSLKSEVKDLKLEVYPNPFSTMTKISMVIGQSAEGVGINSLSTTALGPSLKIYDATGRLVRNLPIHRFSDSPVHQVQWHGTDESGRRLRPGVYFVWLKNGANKQMEKVVLLR